MASERIVTATATVILAAVSLLAWQNYLARTKDAYDDRDAAVTQLGEIAEKLRTTEDPDESLQLTNDQVVVSALFRDAARRVNEIDGWNSFEWKLKNTVRLAAPAATALFAAFTLLSIVHPMGPRYG